MNEIYKRNTFQKEKFIIYTSKHVEIKYQLLLQILLLAQHVSGTTMPIIRSSRLLYRWLLPVVFGALVFKFSEWCGAEGYVSGIVGPQTKHITLSSTPFRQLENQSTKYHRQQPRV
jgi:hypothetical protein